MATLAQLMHRTFSKKERERLNNEKNAKSQAEKEAAIEESKPFELKYFNPFGVKINSIAKLNHPLWEGILFKLRGIREVNRMVGNQKFPLADYDFIGHTLDEEDESSLRIRLIPIDNPDGDFDHKAILLRQVNAFGYDADFHKRLSADSLRDNSDERELIYYEQVTDDDGNPIVDENGDEVFDSFYRVDDVEEFWGCETNLLIDKDNNGKVDENEITHGNVAIWDFWRQTEDDSGEFIEYFIIEMDNETGYFEIWRGEEIDDPSRIEIN